MLEALEDRTTPSAPLAGSGLLSAALAQPLVAPSTTSATLTGPVAIQSFSVVQNTLMANGQITLPGNVVQSFSTPVTVTQHAGKGSTILDLKLGPVHLDVLGLDVNLDQIHLTITAIPGPGQLLGNLLSGSGGLSLDTLSQALNEAFAAAGLPALANPLGSGAGLNQTATQLANQLEALGISSAVPTNTAATPILDLTIQHLEINLLGLDVKLQGPLHLTITAIPGPGNLLGNLLSNLAHLLDNGAGTTASGVSLSSILNLLTSSLLGDSAQGTASAASQVSAAAQAQATPNASTTIQILYLDLGPVHLNLLGLVVDLSEVKLLITAQSGPGNLLGNLLVGLLDGGGDPLTTVGQVLGVLGQNTPLSSLTLPGILSGLPGQLGQSGNSSVTTAAATKPVTILDLTIPPINLDLLGLRVQTLTTIHLTITAVPGPGNLLGNLLADLANLLNPSSVLAAA